MARKYINEISRNLERVEHLLQNLNLRIITRGIFRLPVKMPLSYFEVPGIDAGFWLLAPASC